MSDVAEFRRLMAEDPDTLARQMEQERKGFSASFSDIPPELRATESDSPTVMSAGDPSIRITEGQPSTDEDEAAVKELAGDITRRDRLFRAQEFGENLGYAGLAPTVSGQVMGAAGDLIYTGAAGARYLGGEEGAAGDVAIGAVGLALPIIPVAMVGKLFKKAEVEGANKLLKDLDRDMSEAGEQLRGSVDRVTEKFNAEMASLKEAAKEAGWSPKDEFGAPNPLPGKFGSDAQKALEAQSTALKAISDKYAESGGLIRSKYKAEPTSKISYGLGGRAEEAMTQPFKGGETIITGRKGARSPSVEDTMRESRQITDPHQTRLPTASEKQQLEELGQIVKKDPNARDVAIVSESGEVLAGKPGTKAAKDAPDAYPEGTAEIVANMPLEKEYAHGLGVGTKGMSKSLVNSLSELAYKEFPPGETVRRALGKEPEKYFDTLTPDQQKQLLKKAKLQPGLRRDIARHEQSVAEAAKRVPVPTVEPPASSRKEMLARRADIEAKEAIEAMPRKDVQAGLKGQRKATGTTEQLEKRAVRERGVQAAADERTKKEFLFEAQSSKARFTDEELGFIEQEVMAGNFPPTKEALDSFIRMREGLNIVYNPKTMKFEPQATRTGGMYSPEKQKTKDLPENPEFQRTSPVEPDSPAMSAALAELTGGGLPRASDVKRSGDSEKTFKAKTVSGKKGEGYIPVDRKPSAKRSADEVARRRGLRKKKLSNQSEDITSVDYVDEAKRIQESAGATRLFPTYEAYQEEARNLKVGIDELREMGMPVTKADFLADREEQVLKYVEEPVQPLVRKLLSEGKEPFMSNAYGPGDKGVWFIRSDGTKGFVPFKGEIK
jgi:hypothetical protein